MTPNRGATTLVLPNRAPATGQADDDTLRGNRRTVTLKTADTVPGNPMTGTGPR